MPCNVVLALAAHRHFMQVSLACLKSEFQDLGSRKQIVTDVFVLPFPWHRAPQRGQEGV